MDNPKNQIAEKLKEANNVLVTVSANPTVDQLAAAIGLTLLLNKLDKHASAVFSGKVPSTIEFLRPEETIEKNTDSLRDFIISLDKSKADKLRYKVEDKMVKIFITPYRTSITDQDLIFSQGDFNVDVVVGIGVKVREDLDQAISSHGGILHDATVVSINTAAAGSIGSINWVDVEASSLCEMIVAESEMLKSGLLDAQISTALLTGIVAETERFSNAKTTSNTMNASAKLMAAGANQQLVATQLEAPEPAPVPEPEPEPEPMPEIVPEPEAEKPETVEPSAPDEPQPPKDTIAIGEDGTLLVEHQQELPEPHEENESPQSEGELTEDRVGILPDESQDYQFISEPPKLADEIGKDDDNGDSDIKPAETEEVETADAAITEPESENKIPAAVEANTEPEPLELPEQAVADAVEPPAIPEQALMEPEEKIADEPAAAEQAPDLADEPQYIETPQLQTLDAIEHSVGSPHINQVQPAEEPEMTEPEEVEQEQPVVVANPEDSELDEARNAVQAAMEQAVNTPEISPADDAPADLPDIDIDPVTGNITPPPTVISPTTPAAQPESTSQSPNFQLPAVPLDGTPQYPAPPPVPPPMMPPVNGNSTSFASTPNPFSLPPA